MEKDFFADKTNAILISHLEKGYLAVADFSRGALGAGYFHSSKSNRTIKKMSDVEENDLEYMKEIRGGLGINHL